jgi:ribonuclease HI
VSNVNIYTDGSSRGNPGPGGYGVILEFQGKRKELSQGFRKTTNNRMELLAVIVGLEHLTTNKYLVCIQSDSKYVIDSITKGWVFDWQKKNFKGKKNEDLWRRYLAIHAKFKLQFTWLKGHAGHPENERCDELAVSAALSNELLVDENFESQEE